MKLNTKPKFFAKQIKVLEKKQAQEIAELVLSFPELYSRTPWPGAKGKTPFFVLGEPAYLHRNRKAKYLPSAKIRNQFLQSKFKELYEMVRMALQKELGENCKFRSDASRPGFHIMLSHPAFQKKAGNWHFDLDHSLLKWEKPVDIQKCLSFTLALEIPSSGAKIEFGDTSYEDYVKCLKAKNEKKLKPKLTGFIKHKLGYMVIQMGPGLHRIAAISKNTKLPFKRISFQGLAVKQGRTWQIFW